ncbi:hypothetical protein V6Z12_A12G161600 [Gossypium hirsutum]
MASSSPLSPILLSLFLVFICGVSAQTAPAPAPSGPLNFTGILDKNGQYTYFLQLLAQTQVGSQVQTQLKTTTEGFTVFAPTDNAFNNLKPGTVNNLDPQQKVQLVLYHVIPKYYSLNDLQFVSNPVRTQAAGLSRLRLTTHYIKRNLWQFIKRTRCCCLRSFLKLNPQRLHLHRRQRNHQQGLNRTQEHQQPQMSQLLLIIQDQPEGIWGWDSLLGLHWLALDFSHERIYMKFVCIFYYKFSFFKWIDKGLIGR